MTDTRPAPFFRGSELPRLLVLVGVMLVGWGILWVRVRTQPAPETPPPRVESLPPLPPPDPSPPFQGLQDRSPMNARDNAAYAALLERARTVPFAELSAASRHDVRFAQLIENPERFRGLPIHVNGTVLRVLRQNVEGSDLFPTGTYFEAYAITPDSQNNPWVLAFENAPPNLEVGDNLRQRVQFDGYFLKLWAYKAGDTFRVAPLLVGRFPPAPVAPAAPPSASRGWLSGNLPILLLLVALTIYTGIRFWLQLQRIRQRTTPRRPRSAFTDQIEPEQLQSWINDESQEPPNHPDGSDSTNGHQPPPEPHARMAPAPLLNHSVDNMGMIT